MVRFSRASIWAALLLLMSCASPGPAAAQDAAIDAVEEDWELVVGEPDYDSEGPQITTVMSPTADSSAQLFAFNVNYRSQPCYRPGGLEVVAYRGDEVIGSSCQQSSRLNEAEEIVTWTQRLSVREGVLSYEIDGGQSSTWGHFGQGEGTLLSASMTSSLTSLAGYSPAVSARHSGAGWQGNRVVRMRILRIRYYSGGHNVQTDSSPRVVLPASGS